MISEGLLRVLLAGVEERVVELCEETTQRFTAAMDDDLNTPMALAAIFDMVNAGNKLLNDSEIGDPGKAMMTKVMDELVENILGVKLAGDELSDEETALLGTLERTRETLRNEKMYDEADEMRNALEADGYTVSDNPDGTSKISK